MLTARQKRAKIGSRKLRKANPVWTLELHQRRPDPKSNNTVKAERKVAAALAKEAERTAALTTP